MDQLLTQAGNAEKLDPTRLLYTSYLASIARAGAVK